MKLLILCFTLVLALVNSKSALSPQINSEFQSKFDPQKVRWIYMSPPIPRSTVNTLYPDQNPNNVSQLLQWIDQAEETDGTGLTAPLHGRSMALEMVYQDGSTQEIRPAWKCSSFKDLQGNTHTSCSPVVNKIYIADSDGHEWFAQSKPLFDFVNTTYKEWMPDLRPFEWPDFITVDEIFHITGHGSMMEKVFVKLSQNNKVVWKSEEVEVDHGEFVITGMLDSKNYRIGDYYLEIVGVPYKGFETSVNNRGIGTSIKVENN